MFFVESNLAQCLSHNDKEIMRQLYNIVKKLIKIN